MEKIRKYMIPVIIAIIAIGSGISYLQKGNVVIERGTTNTNFILNEEENIESDKIEETDKTESISGKVNLNTASEDELQVAPGIGPSKAQAIIKYREQYGKFTSVEELTEISGIGEKTLEKIKDYYTVE